MKINLPPKWSLIVKKETISTNEDAKTLPSATDKTVVCARTQTAGRGRMGRRWNSPEGNLYLSLCLNLPNLKGAEFYSFLSAVALVCALENVCSGIEIKCKWPNDLLIKGRKVSGILLETNGVDRLIVGIGVNVTSFPSDTMLYPATSLAANGFFVDRERVLEAFVKQFDTWQKLFKNEGKEPVLEAWRQKAYGVGEKITVNLPDKRLEGIFDGLDNNGCLLLNKEGEIIKIMTGDVFFGLMKRNEND